MCLNYLIHKHLFKPFPLPSTKSVEAVAVELSNHLIICYMYLPPSNKLDLSDMEAVFRSRSAALIVGDLNSKGVVWNNPTDNHNGRILLQYLQDTSSVNIALHLGIILDTPTLVVKLQSDHIPLHLCVHVSLQKRIPYTLRYDRAKWKDFRNFVNEHLTLLARDTVVSVHSTQDLSDSFFRHTRPLHLKPTTIRVENQSLRISPSIEGKVP